MPVPLIDYAGLPAAERQRLESALAELTTLERVLNWARGLKPPAGVDEILTQDEYTHDVIIPGPGGQVSQFRHDLTRSCAAVVVWPTKPTHHDLLEARLRRGWKPTASGLKSGPQVLGYAACVFEHPHGSDSTHAHPHL